MNRIVARSVVVVVAAGLAGAALSGCTPTAPTHTPHSPHASSSASSSPSASASATPSATPTPVAVPFPQNLGAMPVNALFRITAKAVQPNGATMDLTQTVYAPSVPNASDIALLNAQCNMSGSPTWQSSFPGGYKFLETTFSAQPDFSTPAFNTKASIAAYMDFSVSAFSGAYHTAQAYCASGYFSTLPGAMHGVGVVLASNPAGGSLGWASPDRNYGFYGDGNDPSDANGGGDTIVKDCAVTISAAALAAAPALHAWETQAYVQNKSCAYVP